MTTCVIYLATPTVVPYLVVTLAKKLVGAPTKTKVGVTIFTLVSSSAGGTQYSTAGRDRPHPLGTNTRK